jgi:hypothetical protein
LVQKQTIINFDRTFFTEIRVRKGKKTEIFQVKSYAIFIDFTNFSAATTHQVCADRTLANLFDTV